MLVLGIETTCDETGCAVVRDGREILSNIVASQADLHAKHGGVIPELASRRHIDNCVPVLEEALEKAEVTLDEIDLIAVANGPGLIGALLVGINFAKGLAYASGKPLIGVNHVEAHLFSALMEHEIAFPALGVVISGGHTALHLVRGMGDYTLIGQTQDDAIGEAFDKVARLLGLPYPGGPEIERLAKRGDPTRFPFKAGRVKERPFDFSFSGLKTNVLYALKGQNGTKNSPLIIDEGAEADVAASFQEVALGDIVTKSRLAFKEFGCKSLLFGGGVSNNRRLREMFGSDLPAFWPSSELSLDNGAMIAGLASHLFDGNETEVEPFTRVSL